MKDLFYESIKDTSGNIYALKQKEYNGRLHFHRAIEFSYMMSGKAEFIVNDESFIAESDEIAFCHCFYPHRALVSFRHEKLVVAVPEKFAPEIFALLREKTLPAHLDDKEFNRSLRPYIEKLVDWENMSPIVLKGYVSIIFGLLIDRYKCVSVKPKSKNVHLVAKILSYIDENYTNPITLDATAMALGYNKSYFSRFFNHCMGTSFNNYINVIRLDRFDELLSSSNGKSMTELAFECGFSSLATFYRVKKARAEGKITPPRDLSEDW